MVSYEEESQRCEKVGEHAAGCFCIARFCCSNNESGISLRIVLERIINVIFFRVFAEHIPIDVALIVQVSIVDVAYVILLKDVVYVLFLMDREDLPVRVDTAATRS